MRKPLLYVILNLLSISFSFAQDDDFLLTMKGRNLLSIDLSQLPFSEIQLSNDYFLSDKLSLEVSLGYKIPLNNEKYDATRAPFQYLHNYEKNGGYMPFNPAAKGIVVAFGPKLNFTRNLYLTLQGFYRKHSYEKTWITFYENGDDIKNIIRSETQEAFGSKLLFGFRTYASDGMPLYLDLFGGFGYRKRTRSVEDFGSSIKNEPTHTKQTRYLTTPQIGLKLGYMF